MKPSPPMEPAMKIRIAAMYCLSSLLACGASDGAGAPVAGSSTGEAAPTPPAPPTTGADEPTTTTSAPPPDEPASTSTSGGSSTGADDDAVCGDAVVQPGEECDQGYPLNDDLTGTCTSTCRLPICGDGLVQVGLGEACDDGDLNAAEPGYDQCSTACLRGPHCGDGLVQPDGGEECEPVDGQDELDNCAAGCLYKPRLIFITSESYTGALGGIAGADKACNQLAAQVPGMHGTFRAWLLVDGQALTVRFPEFSQALVPWNFIGTDGTPLAQSFQDLIETGPKRPIIRSELGELLADRYVWTNITADGTAATGDCAQWTAAAGSARIGHSGFHPNVGPEAEQWLAERWWTDLLDYPCNKTNAHLYCIQVAD
jgi:hypothetical protein